MTGQNVINEYGFNHGSHSIWVDCRAIKHTLCSEKFSLVKFFSVIECTLEDQNEMRRIIDDLHNQVSLFQLFKYVVHKGYTMTTRVKTSCNYQ